MKDAYASLPAACGDPSTVDWEHCLATHRPWLRKVIWARTGEEQAIWLPLRRSVAAAGAEQVAALRRQLEEMQRSLEQLEAALQPKNDDPSDETPSANE